MNPYDLLSRVFGSKDVVLFRQRVHATADACLYNKHIRFIPSGSRAEGIELTESDYDIMCEEKTLRVYETTSQIDPTDDKVRFIMDTNHTKLGFTWLRIYDDGVISNCDTNIKLVSIMHDGFYYLSSALAREFDMSPNIIIHGPCKMLKNADLEIEHLSCLGCKEWISVAEPWICRERGTWPRKELIDIVIQSGVLFVPVGCKTSKHEDIEWRISFSIAEKQLIHSFTHVQILCYAMLKTIVSDIVKKLHGGLLCSYFIKTIMFWLSEEKDIEFWKATNVILCYIECLKRLIYCVQYRVCLQYFIPEINYFEERFNDQDQKALLGTLHDIYSRGWKTLLCTNTFLEFTTIQSCYPEAASSAVKSFTFISLLLVNKSINEIARCRLFRNISFTITRMMVHFIAISSHFRTLKCKCKFKSQCGNKELYYQYKSMLPDILISTKTDCVSGWCMLASLFYKMKLYNRCKYIVHDCLDKCTPGKNYNATVLTYNSFPKHVHRLLLDERYFSRILQYCCINIVKFDSLNLIPTELSNIFENQLNTNSVMITPTIYLFFLDLLCNHNLKRDHAKRISFLKLQMNVQKEYFKANNYYHICVAQKILNASVNIMRNL